MFKKLIFILNLLFLCSYIAISQPENNQLSKADSLFARQRFTQSFELYDSLYHQKMASPSMLLKMAYIKEGLGDFTSAQYYLNEYYLATSNELTLNKMDELAKEKDLIGYETNDLNFFITLYYKHFQWLTIGLLTISLLLFVFLIIHLFKFRAMPPINTFFLALSAIALFVLINFGKTYNKGLITKNNTFVMEGPSAGAEVLDVIGKGNKVVIDGQTDVWLEIKWEGKQAFIKKNNVRLLTIW